MRINRALLERLINEELVRFIDENLTEAAPEIGTALDAEPPPMDDEFGGPPLEADGEVGDGGEDPADDDIDADLAGEDPEVPGSVAADMQGKTIDSIEEVDESESIPGAKELVLSFQGEEDKLRVIITPSGNVKYFWKGLHNDIGSTEDVPPEEIEQEEELEAGDEDDDLDVDSPALPTDDGGMEDPLNPEV